jgi:hypothetical protein
MKQPASLAVALAALLAPGLAAAQAPPPADTCQAGEWRVGVTPAVLQTSGDCVRTRIGGWVDASYQDNDVAADDSSISVNHANVFADTRRRDWQLFAEAEWEHETSLSGFEAERELELEQLWGRVPLADAMGLRLGRFNTPFGYWVPIHWEILMDTLDKPLHVGDEWVPEQQIGAELSGHWRPDPQRDFELRGALFSGIGPGGWAQRQVDGVTVGGDLRLVWGRRALAGVSAYRQRNEEKDDRTEMSGAVYGELRPHERVTLRGEWIGQDREAVAGTAWEEHVSSLYASARFDAADWLYLGYRFGLGDLDDEDALAGERQRVHTLTLGFVPHRDVRIKLEWSDHRVRSGARDSFAFWGASLGVLF